MIDESLFGYTVKRKPEDSSVAVVSMGDYQRMRESAAGNCGQRTSDNAERHKRAQAKAAKWDNTIAGLQKRRLEERQRRIDAEEDRKKELDREMEVLEMKEHAAAIQKARDYMYNTDDRVQEFKRAEALSDCLNTVNEQVAERRAAAENAKAEDAGWSKKLVEQDAIDRARDAAAKVAKREAGAALQKERVAQLEERRAALQAVKDQDLAEGRKIAAQAVAAEKAEIEKAAAAKRAALMTNKENTKVWAEQEAARAELAEHEKADLAAAEAVSEWSGRIAAERSAREKLFVDAAVDRRNKTYDKLTTHLAQQTSTFERRLANDIKEAEEKHEKQEEDKKRKQAEMAAMCDRQRQLQLKRAAKEAEREAAIADSMRRNLDLNVTELKATEQQERFDGYLKAKEIALHQRTQAVRERSARTKAKASETALYEATTAGIMAEEEEFVGRYRSDIEKRRAAGEAIGPLAVSLHKVGKRGKTLEG